MSGQLPRLMNFPLAKISGKESLQFTSLLIIAETREMVLEVFEMLRDPRDYVFNPY